MSPDHCRPVPLSKAYRLLNHGPTVLVSAAHDGQRNIMAAAWAMPLDFEPPKVAVVLDKATWTRQLLERAGTFVLQVPCAAQADLVQTVGTTSGAELDKFAAYGLRTFNGEHTEAPLLEGCVAWLECRLLPNRTPSRPTTCSSAKWSRRMPTSACSAKGTGTSKALINCAPCTMWRAGISSRSASRLTGSS